MSKPIGGRTYLYHGNEVKIISVTKMRDDLYVVETETKQLRVHPKDFKEFLPVEVPPASRIDPNLLPIIREQNKPLESLTAKLMKAIGEIEENPKFIPQAKAINDTARNLITIAKVQVDLIKTLRSK